MQLSTPLASAQTTWHAMVAQALQLMRATLDFCAVLGLLIGFLFGFELATQLHRFLLQGLQLVGEL